MSKKKRARPLSKGIQYSVPGHVIGGSEPASWEVSQAEKKKARVTANKRKPKPERSSSAIQPAMGQPTNSASSGQPDIHWLRWVWESEFGKLQYRWRQRFLEDESALLLASMEKNLAERAVRCFGPKLTDVLRAIEHEAPGVVEGLPPKFHKIMNDLESIQSNDIPEFSVHEFAGLWFKEWKSVPSWSDSDKELIVEVCGTHQPAHIKSSIRAVRSIEGIAARCNDLASGSNPGNVASFSENAFERDTVNPPPKPSGLGPIQNYDDDT